MEIITIVSTVLEIIGLATILLHAVSPLTKWKGDDKIVSFLDNVLRIVSLNQKDGKLEIKIK